MNPSSWVGILIRIESPGILCLTKQLSTCSPRLHHVWLLQLGLHAGPSNYFCRQRKLVSDCAGLLLGSPCRPDCGRGCNFREHKPNQNYLELHNCFALPRRNQGIPCLHEQRRRRRCGLPYNDSRLCTELLYCYRLKQQLHLPLSSQHGHHRGRGCFVDRT